MKKFIIQILKFSFGLLLLFIIPISTFFIYDPFKVVYTYDEFSNTVTELNADYIATEKFIKNNCKHNSFIFGSSRAGHAFIPEDWENCLPENDNVFSYASSNESIYGILGKLKLIEQENCSIKNVLLIIDTDVTMRNTSNSKGHLFIKHYLVSGESRGSMIQEYLKDYIFSGFFIRFLDYQIFGERRKYMRGYLNFDYSDTIYVPYNAFEKERSIQKNPESYYEKLSHNFSKIKRSKKEMECDGIINSKGKSILEEIHEIFVRNNTNYSIIISPLYDQKKLSKDDLQVLFSIFGENNIHNFSGKNSITEDKRNYYEWSHYRIKIGRSIINKINHCTDSVN